MAQKKCIGLVYKYDEAWIGGTYYVENIIKALNQLDDSHKPFIYLFTEDKGNFDRVKSATAYPYMTYHSLKVQFNLLERMVNRMGRFLGVKAVFNSIKVIHKISFIYPNPKEFIFQHIDINKRIFWIPDFQDVHLPQYFTESEKIDRENWYDYLASKTRKIVFSSSQVLSDFEHLYPTSTVKTSLLPFAVTSSQEVYSEERVVATKEKYDIRSSFFICSNQLWAHKNHKVILEAAKLLNEEDKNIKILISGKEEDYRNPNFPQELKNLVPEFGIEEEVTFLGFIPKVDLEILVQEARGIIQPSLFEGWNTSIEEGKAKGKFIIASNIAVHREQLLGYHNSITFNPSSPNELKNILIDMSVQNENCYDYSENIKSFANSILKLG